MKENLFEILFIYFSINFIYAIEIIYLLTDFYNYDILIFNFN